MTRVTRLELTTAVLSTPTPASRPSGHLIPRPDSAPRCPLHWTENKWFSPHEERVPLDLLLQNEAK